MINKAREDNDSLEEVEYDQLLRLYAVVMKLTRLYPSF